MSGKVAGRHFPRGPGPWSGRAAGAVPRVAAAVAARPLAGYTGGKNRRRPMDKRPSPNGRQTDGRARAADSPPATAAAPATPSRRKLASGRPAD